MSLFTHSFTHLFTHSPTQRVTQSLKVRTGLLSLEQQRASDAISGVTRRNTSKDEGDSDEEDGEVSSDEEDDEEDDEELSEVEEDDDDADAATSSRDACASAGRSNGIRSMHACSCTGTRCFGYLVLYMQFIARICRVIFLLVCALSIDDAKFKLLSSIIALPGRSSATLRTIVAAPLTATTQVQSV